MKLRSLELSHFVSFSSRPVRIVLGGANCLIVPNCSFKTAGLQALCRLFAFGYSLQRIQSSPFHIFQNETNLSDKRELRLEADSYFSELLSGYINSVKIPYVFHLHLDEKYSFFLEQH